jgi:hypothetical protein
MYVEKRGDIIKTFAFDKHTEGSDKDEISLFVCCGRDINYSIVVPDDSTKIFTLLDF